VVATTGHTDLRPEDMDALAHRVRQVFDQLRERYPNSEIEVVSPLAEGADRLVARVALEYGLRLIVPLPMEPDEYKTDFGGPASLAEFDELRARAARSFVVRDATGRVAARPDCYEQIGAYVATHCHVLLALWNGHTPHKTGGTAEIVRFRLEGVPARYAGGERLLDPADTGVVHQIVTPRLSDPTTVGEPCSLHLRAPKGHGTRESAVRDQERIFESTDAFNALAAANDDAAEARRAKSEGWLLSASKATALAPGARAIRTLHGYADELAIRFQGRTLWTLRTLFWMGFAAIVSFEVFAHELEAVPPALPISMYVVLLGVAFWLVRRAEHAEFDRRYLDYRALAEGLRVQFFWRIARVPDSVADYYMRYRLQEVEWIRQALRGCELWITPAEDAEALPEAHGLHIAVSDWIDDQRGFFVRTAKRDQASLERHERRAELMAKLSVALGVLTAVAILSTLPWGRDVWRNLTGAHEYLDFTLVFLIGLLPSAAALIQGYADKRALSAHVKRYSHMAFLFQAASAAIKAPMANGDWPAARRVLREMGRAALEENADWLMVHRERPLEVPQ
jgi:hypothetical protein